MIKKIMIIFVHFFIIQGCRENEPEPIPIVDSVNILNTLNGNNIIEFTTLREDWAKIEINGKDLGYIDLVRVERNGWWGGAYNLIIQNNSKIIAGVEGWDSLGPGAGVYKISVRNRAGNWSNDNVTITVY